MISIYAPDSPHRVMSQSVWLSGTVDPREHGRRYSFTESFFPQFRALQLAVPRRGMQQMETNENCQFITYGSHNKNCYMVFACTSCQDVYYSSRLFFGKDAADCFMSIEGELLYECVDCQKCYRCAFCKDSVGCRESYFLDRCHGCVRCIACKNLRGKEYHMWNRPVSPEQYEQFVRTITSTNIMRTREEFARWKLSLPVPDANRLNAEASTGDYLYNVKACEDCYDVHGVQHSRHCQLCGLGAADFMDCNMCGPGDLLYECIGTGPAHRNAFSIFGVHTTDVLYSENCTRCRDCFGCIDLKDAQYCILNKQYTEEEYESLLQKIFGQMTDAGEWGEFFPVHLSPFAYNETIAQELFPLSREVAEERGWKWREVPAEEPSVTSLIPGASLPETADGIPNDIVNSVIVCAATGRPFRIIRQEIDLYRKMGLPLPRLHPDERHRRRVALRNPRKLWARDCRKCGKSIQTSYSPDRPEIVYCESCYLKEVY